MISSKLKTIIKNIFIKYKLSKNHASISADALINAVASKKGTTEAGIKSFKNSGLSKSFDKGIAAAIKRSKEISSEF